jgi:hypothetical protein
MGLADITRVAKKVNAILNVADSYTATPDAGSRLYATQLTDTALDIDGEIIKAGLGNPTWAHRIDFQQSTTVAHAGNIPAHIGAIDAILIGGEPAAPAPLDQITSERQLVSQSITVTPHFNLDGTVLSHNGTSSAVVKSCIYTRTSALQCHEVYEPAIIRGVLAQLASPEGEDIELQAQFARLYQVDLQMIGEGQIPPPLER